LRFLFNLLLLLAIALGTGFGLSWYALTDGRLFGAYQSGPWTAWLRAGTPDPDPYARAFLARNGALQLGIGEGIQLVATTDSDGQQLSRSCRYRLEGTTPTAAFWTLVPTAADGSPITRTDGRPGFSSRSLARANDGSVHLYVSRGLAPFNWLEIVGDGSFSLVLTLYDTTLFSGISSNRTTMPSIIREACA
jgi:hypothetical protein